MTQVMTNLIKRFDHSHFFTPAIAINCAKSLFMSHASLRKNNGIITKHFPAPVVSIGFNNVKKSKQHGTGVKPNSKKELPFHYNEPIFKAKKHDPL
jgi:hypothetical protein